MTPKEKYTSHQKVNDKSSKKTNQGTLVKMIRLGIRRTQIE